MKTPLLKRILSAAARAFAEGVVMADPDGYSYYLRCKAAAEVSARGAGAQLDEREVTLRVAAHPSELILHRAAG